MQAPCAQSYACTRTLHLSSVRSFAGVQGQICVLPSCLCSRRAQQKQTSCSGSSLAAGGLRGRRDSNPSRLVSGTCCDSQFRSLWPYLIDPLLAKETPEKWLPSTIW